MAAYNTSSAYDLSAFEPQQKKQQKPQLRVVERQSAKRAWVSAFSPKALGSFAIVVTLIVLMVYNQVQLNELTGEMNAIQAELEVLESEYIRGSSELDSMISMRTISERAKDELGMDRLARYQTEYVYLYGEDQITITEQAPAADSGAQVEKAASSFIDTILEYIGVR